jgi:D-glycero-D-manno-heptose 1,7-bisphosphate phosphatase
MPLKTIFLDRDGVINKEVNYLHEIDSFEFIDGIFEACKYFLNVGYEIIIITNQSGISRGYYNQDDYDILTKWMLERFKENDISILDIFHCPHSPEDNCKCRKPKPGMIFAAKNKYDINLSQSWLIGDKETDIIAANNAGISNTILVKSGHKINERETISKIVLASIKESQYIIN